MKEQGHPGSLTIRTEHRNGRLTVQFTDTGPGIEAEERQRIFEPFFTTKSESKGTGLGLSISYGIIKAHGGHIHVQSDVGAGTTFTVELPVIAGDPVSAEEKSEEKHSGLSVLNVLVVDDEETIDQLIAEMLRAEGCSVDFATTGEQALEKMKEQMYDLVICDIRMPGMDGREVYSRVERDIPQLAQRFLFLTGDISEQTRAFLQETDKPYLFKPFTREAFLEAVKQTNAPQHVM
jgi:two-component system NtrC family sensor kinase